MAKDDAAKSFGKCVVQCLCSDVGYVGESDQCVRMHVNGGNVAFGKEKLRVGMAWLVEMDSGGGSPDLAELLLLVHGWFQLRVWVTCWQGQFSSSRWCSKIYSEIMQNN